MTPSPPCIFQEVNKLQVKMDFKPEWKFSVDELLQSSLNSALESFKQTMHDSSSAILHAASWMVKALSNNNKVIFFGNGGSAADSQHLAAEFVNRFRLDRQPLPAIALTTDSSILTSISNDYGYEHIFSKQIEALCDKGDVAVGISTSGASENVVRGLEAALRKGACTVALTGRRKGPVSQASNISIMAASSDTPRIQEVHIFIGHLLCDIVEKELFGE